MKINNPMIRKIGATSLGVLLLIYIGYQVFMANYKGLATETAMYAEMSDSIQADGWAARNEEILTDSQNGVLSFNVSDGEKVAAGDALAVLYENEESAANQSQIERIDSEIANLEVLKDVGDFYTSSVDLIGTQINDSLTQILGEARKSDYAAATAERDHLQYLMNQKRVVTGKESTESYQSRIQELTDEKEALQAASSGKIGAVSCPISGYFISDMDGYESAFDMENIADITVHDIESLKKKSVPRDAMGKVAKDFKWYMVCVLDEQQKIKLEGVSKVKLEIPLATAEQVPAAVVSITKDEESGKYAAVFQCDYMSSELAAIRHETIQIVVATYSGVLVNEKAIHFNSITKEVTDEKDNTTEKTFDNVKGVYIKYGQRLNFVQIFTDVTINGYAVCKLELTEEEQAMLVTENTIQLYDEVVIGGTDLYDGKLL